MKLLRQYFDLQKQIHEYFGYQEDWKVIPLDDQTEMYWLLKQSADGSGEVIFYDDPITQETLDSQLYYSSEIYTQRFLPKWVYRGEQYTMVVADTQTDGNKFLTIFSNAREMKPDGLDLNK